jgi:hypothetical protein
LDNGAEAESLTAILDAKISAKKRGDILDVDKLDKELKRFQRYEIVAALKELELLGRGRFIPGRRTQPSRLVIEDNAPATLPPPSVGEIDAAGPEIRGSVSAPNVPRNTLFVRTNPPIEISLPVDLTRVEADKIVRWVQALAED